jgi:hypothetical protein
MALYHGGPEWGAQETHHTVCYFCGENEEKAEHRTIRLTSKKGAVIRMICNGCRSNGGSDDWAKIDKRKRRE